MVIDERDDRRNDHPENIVLEKVVQQKVVEKAGSKQLLILVVWKPAFQGDDEQRPGDDGDR
jgi:hypothetical protein